MEWRKLHNEELNDLYSSPNICSGEQIEKNEMGGACSTYGRDERHIQGFDGETGGKWTAWEGQEKMDGTAGGGMWVYGLDWAGPG